MNAGKSTSMLQSSYNYQERGMRTVIFTSAFDNRFEHGYVWSRIGISSPAEVYDNDTSMLDSILTINSSNAVDCVLVDEAQFLTKQQVEDLVKVVDHYGIPVLCYGLRTDFQSNLFTGSKYLLALSDKIIELKGICFCGKKATMTLRVQPSGEVLVSGDQVFVGDNDVYHSVCRYHFYKKQVS